MARGPRPQHLPSIHSFANRRDRSLATLGWLHSLGLLNVRTQLCECNHILQLRPSRDCADGWMLRCIRCMRNHSLRRGSIFEGSRLSLLTYLRLVIAFENLSSAAFASSISG